jgi:hypothetical protein
MENHGKYGELIYTRKSSNIYVNLFVPSVLNWKQGEVKLTQLNNFPDEEQTAFSFNLSAPKHFTLFLRKPYWVKDGGFVIKVNDNVISKISSSGGYVGIDRMWHNGDKVQLMLPMKNFAEYLPDHSAWVSFLHGPIVLAAPTDTSNLSGLFANDSRWGHIAGGRLTALTSAPLLVKTSSDHTGIPQLEGNGKSSFDISDMIVQPQFKNLKLIPFYRVHDTRYMLYWPITTKDSISQKEAELAALDEIYLKLVPRTVDEVVPGEQQPESDHAMDAENSETGVFRNRHWRSSKAYFGYRMRLSPNVKSLAITYYGREMNREYDIYVNDSKLAHIIEDGSGPDGFITKEYPLPDEIKAGAKSLIIKFIATDKSSTASIYDIRILR